MQAAPDSRVKATLDLLDLCDDRYLAVVRLAHLPSQQHTLDQLADTLCPGAGRTTHQTIIATLKSIIGQQQTLDPETLHALTARLELCLDLAAELVARTQPRASHLVVTATTTPELADLQRTMQLRPLVQLVEDVIRTATHTCTLGAPYWNEAALERLRPALDGFTARRGRVEIICQGGMPDDEYDPTPGLRRLATDLRANGGNVEIWTFDARAGGGKPALLHAKFALADQRFGYLGSANMTGQGFGHHFEIGVQLAKEEAADLTLLIAELKEGGFLNRDSGGLHN